MSADLPVLPASLRANPRLDRWLRFDADGTVHVQTGKVELGQGILTALAQIVADELGVPLTQVRMSATRTGTHPDEGVTSGSLSLQDSGAALRHVCAEVRELRAGGLSWADLAAGGPLQRDAAPRAAAAATARECVGAPVPRLDIPDKVYGRPRFIHDLALPGMLHGRVLRPPSAAAQPLQADLQAVRACPGVQGVVQDGRMFGVLAETSAQADAALAMLVQSVRWDRPAVLPPEGALADWLQSTPVETTVVREQTGPGRPVARSLAATYERPFVAHASLAPSCALAQWTGDR
ncbi:MAG TPA: molybdopterin cofactor-binding domain-containing protein, partial [Ramlibacter sp.]